MILKDHYSYMTFVYILPDKIQAVMPVECWTNWGKQPTETSTFCWFKINPWVMNKYENHKTSHLTLYLEWQSHYKLSVPMGPSKYWFASTENFVWFVNHQYLSAGSTGTLHCSRRNLTTSWWPIKNKKIRILLSPRWSTRQECKNYLLSWGKCINFIQKTDNAFALEQTCTQKFGNFLSIAQSPLMPLFPKALIKEQASCSKCTFELFSQRLM